MGADTKVSWVDRILPDGRLIKGASWNRWWGCLKVSEECQHCYAEGFAKRVGRDIWGPAANTARWILSEDNSKKPFVWNKAAQKDGHRRSVFCSSMSDVFEDHPLLDAPRQDIWSIIEQTPWLNWLLLTKRPENILKMAPWGSAWPDNVWIGTSIGLQARAEERLPYLLEVPAVVRFLSCEPLIGPVDLSVWLPQLQWIISGGESGPGHRPFDPAWALSLRDQCVEANVPYYFKQHGGIYHDSGGDLLAGKAYKAMPPEFPVVQPAATLF